mgnify:CR=1 FL=1
METNPTIHNNPWQAVSSPSLRHYISSQSGQCRGTIKVNFAHHAASELISIDKISHFDALSFDVLYSLIKGLFDTKLDSVISSITGVKRDLCTAVWAYGCNSSVSDTVQISSLSILVLSYNRLQLKVTEFRV